MAWHTRNTSTRDTTEGMGKGIMSDRDKDRIPFILAALGEMWMKNPNLRLGQIMSNASITFYTEDDRALTELQAWDEFYANTRRVS